MSVIHDQREIRSRTWGPSSRGVRCYVSLPAHGERGVGRGSPSMLDAFPLNWPGRFANRRSGLFHSIARRPPGLSNRRRAGAHPLSYRLVATHSRRFISSRLQFRRIGYQPGSYVSDPFEGHSYNASLSPWFQCPEHRQRTRPPCALFQTIEYRQ